MSGYVYLVKTSPERDVTYFKVGITCKEDYKARIHQIQCNNPSKISVVSVVRYENPLSLEAEILERFKQFRIRGEWFMAFRPTEENDCGLFVTNTLGRDISEFMKRKDCEVIA